MGCLEQLFLYIVIIKNMLVFRRVMTLTADGLQGSVLRPDIITADIKKKVTFYSSKHSKNATSKDSMRSGQVYYS